MSLPEILAEIPKLSFAERQEIIRRTLEVEDAELTPEEKQSWMNGWQTFAAIQIQASPQNNSKKKSRGI
jgi:hypothetical protein